MVKKCALSRTLSLVLALVLVLSLAGPAFATEAVKMEIGFWDDAAFAYVGEKIMVDSFTGTKEELVLPEGYKIVDDDPWYFRITGDSYDLIDIYVEAVPKVEVQFVSDDGPVGEPFLVENFKGTKDELTPPDGYKIVEGDDWLHNWGDYYDAGYDVIDVYVEVITKAVEVNFCVKNGAWLEETVVIEVPVDATAVDEEILKTLVPEGYIYDSAIRDGEINELDGELEVYVYIIEEVPVYEYTVKFYVENKDNVVGTAQESIEGITSAPAYAIRYSDIEIPEGYVLDSENEGDYIIMDVLYVPVKLDTKVVEVNFCVKNGAWLEETVVIEVPVDATAVDAETLKALVPEGYIYESSDCKINDVNGELEVYVYVRVPAYAYTVKFYMGNKDYVVGTAQETIEGITSAPAYAIRYSDIEIPEGYVLDSENEGDYIIMDVLYVPVKLNTKAVEVNFCVKNGAWLEETAVVNVPADATTVDAETLKALVPEGYIYESSDCKINDVNGELEVYVYVRVPVYAYTVKFYMGNKDYVVGTAQETIEGITSAPAYAIRYSDIEIPEGYVLDSENEGDYIIMDVLYVPVKLNTKAVEVNFCVKNGAWLEETAVVNVPADATTVDAETLKALVPEGYIYESSDCKINDVNGELEVYVYVRVPVYAYTVKFYMGNKDNVVGTAQETIEGITSAPAYAIRYSDIEIPEGYVLDSENEGDYILMDVLYVPVKLANEVEEEPEVPAVPVKPAMPNWQNIFKFWFCKFFR